MKIFTKIPVWEGAVDTQLATYIPIFLYLVVLLGFVVVTLVMAHVVGPHRGNPIKDMTYESGMDPIGDARQHFDIKFYLIAVLFWFSTSNCSSSTPGR